MNALAFILLAAAGDWPVYIDWPMPNVERGSVHVLYHDGTGWTHYPHGKAKKHVLRWTGPREAGFAGWIPDKGRNASNGQAHNVRGRNRDANGNDSPSGNYKRIRCFGFR